MERTNNAVVEAQLLVKETLVNTLRDKMAENTKTLDDNSKFRNENWYQFSSTATDVLTGADNGMTSHMKSNFDSMRQSLRTAMGTDEESHKANREGMATRGESLTSFDFELKEWSVKNQVNISL